MKTLAINENNDISLTSSGNLNVAENLSAMGYIFINKSQTNKGELPYDTQKGIDFFNTIFSSPSYPDLFQNEVISQLEDTEDTELVTSFTGNVEGNIYSYAAEIQTIYGSVNLNG